MSEQFKGIQVSGRGKISLPPNIAYVSGGVVTQNEKVTKAIAANNEKMRAVFDALKAAGAQEKEIATTSLQIQAVWRDATKTKPASISGYSARNGVTIKIKDMTKIGDIIDALSATANEIGGLSFAAEYPDKEMECIALAVEDAEAKANVVAKAGGIKLGKLVSCQCISAQPSRMAFAGSRSMSLESTESTPISAGELDLKVNAEVVYSTE